MAFLVVFHPPWSTRVQNVRVYNMSTGWWTLDCRAQCLQIWQTTGCSSLVIVSVKSSRLTNMSVKRLGGQSVRQSLVCSTNDEKIFYHHWPLQLLCHLHSAAPLHMGPTTLSSSSTLLFSLSSDNKFWNNQYSLTGTCLQIFFFIVPGVDILTIVTFGNFSIFLNMQHVNLSLRKI